MWKNGHLVHPPRQPDVLPAIVLDRLRLRDDDVLSVLSTSSQSEKHFFLLCILVYIYNVSNVNVERNALMRVRGEKVTLRSSNENHCSQLTSLVNERANGLYLHLDD